MRRLLGILRENGGPLSLSPQPGLTQLDDLVEQARRAGLAVDVRIDGEPRTLSAGLGLAAYRIVQEALTNPMKHAGRANVVVTLAYGDRDLVIDVADDGTGETKAGGGHGLIGMRERVAVYGGELQTGSRTEGGFRVRARLPLEEARS